MLFDLLTVEEAYFVFFYCIGGLWYFNDVLPVQMSDDTWWLFIGWSGAYIILSHLWDIWKYTFNYPKVQKRALVRRDEDYRYEVRQVHLAGDDAICSYERMSEVAESNDGVKLGSKIEVATENDDTISDFTDDVDGKAEERRLLEEQDYINTINEIKAMRDKGPKYDPWRDWLFNNRIPDGFYIVLIFFLVTIFEHDWNGNGSLRYNMEETVRCVKDPSCTLKFDGTSYLHYFEPGYRWWIFEALDKEPTVEQVSNFAETEKDIISDERVMVVKDKELNGYVVKPDGDQYPTRILLDDVLHLTPEKKYVGEGPPLVKYVPIENGVPVPDMESYIEHLRVFMRAFWTKQNWPGKPARVRHDYLNVRTIREIKYRLTKPYLNLYHWFYPNDNYGDLVVTCTSTSEEIITLINPSFYNDYFVGKIFARELVGLCWDVGNCDYVHYNYNKSEKEVIGYVEDNQITIIYPN